MSNPKIYCLKKELSELQNEQERYFTAYGKGIVPEEIFERKMNDINTHRDRLNSSLVKESKNRGITDKIDVN